jgi:N-acyl-D-amino-acid deacylase
VDFIIRNGTVFDGMGNPGRPVDVAISDGKITRNGEVGANGVREIDADGLYVAPGFIDIHSHSDYTLLIDPRAVSALHQGVTLEVVGNCGHGCFPVREPAVAQKAIYGYRDDVALTWTTAAEYLEKLDLARPAVNMLTLVPNGQLRLATVGPANRAADRDELREMTRLLEQSLEEGAWGLSTGLEYPPEAEASESEIASLCRSVAAVGGIYATHTRRRDDGAADAVAEAVRVAERTGVRTQVSHLLPRSGAREGLRCIGVIDKAREKGLEIAFDMHTRAFGFTHLHAALPPWAINLDRDELAERLRDRSAREKMKTHSSIVNSGGDWNRVVLVANGSAQKYHGVDIAAIASDRGQEPLDAVFDLLLEGIDHLHHLMVTIDCYTEEQQRHVFAHPACMPASDATTLAPDGPLADSLFYGAYTWAAWFYRFMARDSASLSPEAAIHHLTGLPAARLGLEGRGVLRPGANADVVVFSPDAFRERGTRAQPNLLAEGMKHVFVNGELAVSDGAITGKRSGVVLRRRS